MKDEYRKHQEHLKPREMADKARADKARRDNEAAQRHDAAMQAAGSDEQKRGKIEEAYQQDLRDSKTHYEHDLNRRPV